MYIIEQDPLNIVNYTYFKGQNHTAIDYFIISDNLKRKCSKMKINNPNMQGDHNQIEITF